MLLKQPNSHKFGEVARHKRYENQGKRKNVKRVTIARVNVKKLFHSNIKLQEKTILHKKALNQEVKKARQQQKQWPGSGAAVTSG